MPSPSSGVLPPMLFPPLGRRADWPIRLRHQHTPARICPASFRAPPCAGPVLLTQSLEQVAERETDQGSERHAKNRWLNPLSAPPPSEHQRQPASLVIPGSRWCGQHTLFGLGCVHDRIQGHQDRIRRASPYLVFFAHPRFPVSSWQNLGDYAISTFLLAHARPDRRLPVVLVRLIDRS